ncbi:hypothetical protein ACTXT7_003673 [Hymenolepis weldensis]
MSVISCLVVTPESFTPGRLVKRVGKVIYEIQINDDIRIRHKSPLRPRIAGAKSTPTSTPLYFLLDAFKYPPRKSDKACRRTPEQQKCSSKRTRRKSNYTRLISGALDRLAPLTCGRGALHIPSQAVLHFRAHWARAGALVLPAHKLLATRNAVCRLTPDKCR